MLMLAVSDMHGDMDSVRRAVEQYQPELLLACGDWGDPSELEAGALSAAVEGRMVLSTFGNHDRIDTLSTLRNPDGSPVLMGQGEVRTWRDWRIASIGGIWAKHPKKPYHITDDEVRRLAGSIAESGPVDVLLTHGCPVGVADLTPTNRHGGHRCFLEAFQAIRPLIHLCGHLHRSQEYTTKGGRVVINVGQTSAGHVVAISDANGRLSARRDRMA